MKSSVTRVTQENLHLPVSDTIILRLHHLIKPHGDWTYYIIVTLQIMQLSHTRTQFLSTILSVKELSLSTLI